MIKLIGFIVCLVLLAAVLGATIGLITSSERCENVKIVKITISRTSDGDKMEKMFFNNGFALNVQSSNVDANIGDRVILITRRTWIPILNKFAFGNAYMYAMDACNETNCKDCHVIE